MRTVILATLALLPLAAHAQATSASSQTLQAKLNQPATLVHTSVSAPSASSTTVPTPNISLAHVAPATHELVLVSLLHPEMQRADGSLSYELISNDDPIQAAPKLVHVVRRDLPAVDEKHPDAAVALTLTVDMLGNPENIRITKSAGSALDASTLAAVRQYRFKPAIVGNQPIASDLAIEVKLTK